MKPLDSPDQSAGRVPASKSWLWMLGALYVPTLFGFFAPCGHCRKVWLFAWPILPGGVPATFVSQLTQLRPADWMLLTAGVALTAAIWFGLWRARRLGRFWFKVILVSAGLLNFLGALGAYALIRS